MLAAALPISAASYYGYVRNWWVEENGDTTWYFLSNSDVSTTTTAHYVGGYCGAGVYRLKVTNANYDEVYDSLKTAAKNNYKVIMEVTSCEGTINVIKMIKVCTWNGDC